jgi:hypothetical protein
VDPPRAEGRVANRPNQIEYNRGIHGIHGDHASALRLKRFR